MTYKTTLYCAERAEYEVLGSVAVRRSLILTRAPLALLPHTLLTMATATAKNSIYGYPGSVDVTSQTIPGESPIRRLRMTKDRLTTEPGDGITVIPDVLDYAARTHGSKNSYGWRDVVRIHEEKKDVKKVVGGKEVTETKTWKYFELSDYKYVSFVQVKEASQEVAGGLLKLGVKKEDIINIYASTRYGRHVSLPCAEPHQIGQPALAVRLLRLQYHRDCHCHRI